MTQGDQERIARSARETYGSFCGSKSRRTGLGCVFLLEHNGPHDDGAGSQWGSVRDFRPNYASGRCPSLKEGLPGVQCDRPNRHSGACFCEGHSSWMDPKVYWVGEPQNRESRTLGPLGNAVLDAVTLRACAQALRFEERAEEPLSLAGMAACFDLAARVVEHEAGLPSEVTEPVDEEGA